MNYKFYSILFSILTLTIFSSCTEVIVLDLKTTTDQVVIEANLNVTDQSCTVNLSKSSDFYQDNDFEKILGATISLTTNTGNSYILDDKKNGQYTVNDIIISAGENVTIEVNIPDNETYTATASVPKAVSLDTLRVKKQIGGGFGGGDEKDEYQLTSEWKDIDGEENFYRVKVYRNEEYQSEVYTFTDDVLGDGAKITQVIIGERYALGDELRVELLTVNKGYYDYFLDLILILGGGRGFGASTPFNPSGNIDQEVLGYFGVWQISEKIIIVE